jgi:hypothetical protein
VIHLKKRIPSSPQQNLFEPADSNPTASKFIAAYRVKLIRDQDLPFEAGALSNSSQAQTIIRKLIETCGQSDREQFCVVLLNNKNEIIGLNIVSIGSVSAAYVCPREVLNPAILVPYIPMLRENNIRKGFFEHEDFIKLRETLPEYLRDFITFGYKTGWRISEIQNLTWNQVDMTLGIVRLEVGESKNDEGRTVYGPNERYPIGMVCGL